MEANGVLRVDTSTPSQHPATVLQLIADVPVRSWLRLRSTLTTSLGGTTRTSRVGFYNYDDALQHRLFGVRVDEALADVYAGSFDVRIGIQRFAWGKLDGAPPNDLLNPVENYDPILSEITERKIGVPALRGTYFFPAFEHPLFPAQLSVTAVWLPVYVPPRFPDVTERWFPPAARTQQQVGGEFEGVRFGLDTEFDLRNSSPPARTLAHSGLAAKLEGLYGPVETAVYYYRGFDPQPGLALEPVRAIGELTDENLFVGDARIVSFPVFRRIESVGTAVSFPYLDFTVRCEGAYLRGRPFTRDLRSFEIEAVEVEGEMIVAHLKDALVRSDVMEWGAGADYAWRGYFFLGQVNQTVLLNHVAGLVIKNPETRLTGRIAKDFLRDRLEAELEGFYGFEGRYFFLFPQFTYDLRDGLEVTVGGVVLGGSADSSIGQFGKNDEVFMRVKYTF